MAHEHSVIDKDTHFIIDAETMAITCAGHVKALKRGDHAAERYTFEMPRYMVLYRFIKIWYKKWACCKMKQHALSMRRSLWFVRVVAGVPQPATTACEENSDLSNSL